MRAAAAAMISRARATVASHSRALAAARRRDEGQDVLARPLHLVEPRPDRSERRRVEAILRAGDGPRIGDEDWEAERRGAAGGGRRVQRDASGGVRQAADAEVEFRRLLRRGGRPAAARRPRPPLGCAAARRASARPHCARAHSPTPIAGRHASIVHAEDAPMELAAMNATINALLAVDGRWENGVCRKVGTAPPKEEL